MNLQAVVLSFNHPELTARCVRSCLELLDPSQVQLIHNGSRDEFVKRYLLDFPQIQHHILKENRGFTGGANWALKKGFEKSEWTFFITNDCELLSVPDDLTNYPKGLHAPLIYRRKTSRIDSFGGLLDSETGQLSHISEENPKDNIEPLFYVPGTAFLLDQQSFEKVGPFDEQLGTYWEDVDLSLRCHQLGIPLRQNSDFSLRHGIGKTCHKNSHYTNYLYQRNRIRICRKWKAGGEFRFLKDTLLGCAQKARKGHWPEAWRRAKAYLDA